jgi:MFS transporter, DHA3 family, macrolide efflux protein
MDTGYRVVGRQRKFQLLWIGQTVSHFGDTFNDLALIWLALLITHQNYLGIGLVVSAKFVPYLFFGLIGGAYSDRWDRKRTMIVCDLLRGLTVLAIPALDILGHLTLWDLAAVAFVQTTLRAFFQPALQASVSDLLPEEQLVPANAMLHSSFQAMEVLGPAAAGLLFAITAPRNLFVLDSMTFFVSALTLWGIAFPVRTPVETSGRPHILREIASAAQSVRGYPVVFWSLVLFGVEVLAISGNLRLGLPGLAEQVLRGGPQVYGLLMSAMGIGTVVGALLVGRMRTSRYGFWVFVGWAAYGALFVALGLTPWLAVSLGIAALIGGAGAVIDVLMTSLIQSTIPGEQMGKVFSFWSTLANVGESISGPLVGYFMSVISVVPVFVATSALTMLVGCVGVGLVARASSPSPSATEVEQIAELTS